MNLFVRVGYRGKMKGGKLGDSIGAIEGNGPDVEFTKLIENPDKAHRHDQAEKEEKKKEVQIERGYGGGRRKRTKRKSKKARKSRRKKTKKRSRK